MLRLTAVNAVLRRLGMTPVSVRDENGNSAASQAERYLDDADEACQSQGWHFNRKIDVSLTPDGATSKIAVPAGTFYRLDSYGSSVNTNIRVKNGFLYNIDDNTDVFGGPVVVCYIERCLWADLPETFASYIVSEASDALNRSHKNNQALDALLMEEMQRRKVECKREDDEHSDTNVLKTAEMNLLRGRQKTYWSNY